MPAHLEPQVSAPQFDERFVVRADGHVMLDSEAFQAYVDAFLKPVEAFHGLVIPRITKDDESTFGHLSFARDEKAIQIQGRKDVYRLYCTELPARESLEVYLDGYNRYGTSREQSRFGYVFFRRSVFFPVLTTNIDLWMSLTPFEIHSQRAGVRKARGNVLVGGLGIGWFARQVLKRKEVSRVTVVEHEQALIDFFGPPLLREFGDRLSIIHGDAFDRTTAKPSRYDSVLFDIWAGFGASKGDSRWSAIAETHPNAWAW